LIGNSAVKLGFYPIRKRVSASSRSAAKRKWCTVAKFACAQERELRDISFGGLDRLQDRKLILFQGIDITERKSAEKALREHE